jgi:hypothetical protein
VSVLDALRECVQQAQTVADKAERSSEVDLRRAIDALIAAMPADRAVKITPEVVDAAVAGDVALLGTLLAPEVEADEIDLAALRDADAADDGSRVSLDDACAKLGLTR